MDYEYRKIRTGHFDSQIIFYGREKLTSNYVYSGNNIRDCFVLHFVLDGKGTFSSAGKKMVTLGKNDVFLLPKNIPCFYQADVEEPWEYFWIGLSGNSVQDILYQSKLQKNFYLKEVEESDFFSTAKVLYDTLRNEKTLINQLKIESLLFKLLFHLLHEFPGENKSKENSSLDYYHIATELMRDNLTDGYNVSDVCATMHLSRSYLYTVFKKHGNQSPQAYLGEMRMNRAKELLKDTNFQIVSIATMTGYKDPFTFSKAFKRSEGMSPLDYRNNV